MTILLIEDHQPTREAIRTMVEEQPDIRVVGEAATGEDGLTQALSLRPEIVLVDVFLPGINGVETTRLLCAQQPGVKALALSNHFGASLVQTLLDAGGKGYVQKSRAFEELVPALRAVAAGRQYVSLRQPERATP